MKVNMLRNSDIHKVDLVPDGAQQLSKIEIMKSKEEIPVDEKKVPTAEELEALESQLKEIADKLGISLEDEKEDHEEIKELVEEKVETEEVDKVENVEETEEIKETENTEVKEALAKAASAEAEANKLKAEIAKMNDERQTQEFIAKAKGFENIPGVKAEDLGSVLKSLFSTNPDLYNKVEEILKSANDTIGNSSLFVEKGTAQVSTGDPASKEEAWNMIEKLAESRVTKGISNSTNCIADVLKTPEGEALYAKYKSF